MTLHIFVTFALGESACCNEMVALMIHIQSAVAFMFIGAAAPDKASIGATNGIAQVADTVLLPPTM